MSQQAEIKHRHCMTYNKLESGVNSAKQLLFSHHHHCYALWGVRPIGKSSCTEDEMLTSQ